jgi:hypothetical protein
VRDSGIIDFTRQDRKPANHWVIGATGLNSTHHQASLSSWNSFQAWTNLITYQIVYVPRKTLKPGNPLVQRVLIDKLECVAADIQSLCPAPTITGTISSSSNTISGSSGGSSTGGIELDPISVSGGYPVYDLYGLMDLSLTGSSITLQGLCPDAGSGGISIDVASFMLFSYVSYDLNNDDNLGASQWQERDPVHNPNDAAYSDYLSMSIDPFYKRGVCGWSSQPYSARKWSINLPNPIIIGPGQALHVAMACTLAGTGTTSMTTVFFARARVREME